MGIMSSSEIGNIGCDTKYKDVREGTNDMYIVKYHLVARNQRYACIFLRKTRILASRKD
jgi:hypothetical protein